MKVGYWFVGVILALTIAPFTAEEPLAAESETVAATSPAEPTTQENALVAKVKMETSMGNIVLELDAEKAPISTLNFLSYVDDGFYDGTIFHRIIPTFMIQGGGYVPGFEQKRTKPTIKNEWRNGLKNVRGTIAMARIGGNPDSASSQFFINVVDNRSLDMPQPDGAAYAVFGKVVEGMDVVDKIKDVPTRNEMRIGGQPAPIQDVVIQKVTILNDVDREALKKKFGA